jgi:hypothetical protein
MMSLLQLEDLEVTGADYIKPAPLGNFRAVWEELPAETEREDDYGLGHRENLQVCLPVTGAVRGCHTISAGSCLSRSGGLSEAQQPEQTESSG